MVSALTRGRESIKEELQRIGFRASVLPSLENFFRAHLTKEAAAAYDATSTAREHIVTSYPHADTGRATRTAVLLFRLSSTTPLVPDIIIPCLLMS
jgi:hypothetical protein